MSQLFGFLPSLAVETVSSTGADGPQYTVESLSSSPILKLLHDMGFTGIVDFFQVTLGFGSSAPPLVEIFFATILSFLLTSMIGSVYKATFRGAKLSQDY